MGVWREVKLKPSGKLRKNRLPFLTLVGLVEAVVVLEQLGANNVLVVPGVAGDLAELVHLGLGHEGYLLWRISLYEVRRRNS